MEQKKSHHSCHFPDCTSKDLMVKMVQQDIGWSSLEMAEMTSQPLWMLLPFPQKTNSWTCFMHLHSWFNMWIPDTWEVEVLVPLLEVVELEVLEVLELDVLEVLEVVEDVDVWRKGIRTWDACCTHCAGVLNVVFRYFGCERTSVWEMFDALKVSHSSFKAL